MSKNISNATLSANAEKTYGIDEFRSMASYTKFLDAETKGKINGLILNPVVGDKADKGKALSRVELKKIFDKFDSSFNSASGRYNILNKVIRDAMLASGYRGSDPEEFMKDFLRCGEDDDSPPSSSDTFMQV